MIYPFISVVILGDGCKKPEIWTEIIPVACVLRDPLLKRVPALWDKKTEKARKKLGLATNII